MSSAPENFKVLCRCLHEGTPTGIGPCLASILMEPPTQTKRCHFQRHLWVEIEEHIRDCRPVRLSPLLDSVCISPTSFTDPTFDFEAWKLRHLPISKFTTSLACELCESVSPSGLIATVVYFYGVLFAIHTLSKDRPADIGDVAHLSRQEKLRTQASPLQ